METRKHSQTLLEGAMILGAAAFLSKVIGLLYRIPITNVLGDIGNSYYSIAYNIYVILITISAVGLPAAISKLVAERIEVKAYKEAHRVYKVALTYSTILSMILAIGMWFGANAISILFFNSKDVALPIRALAPTVVIVTMMAAMRGYFQGMRNMTPTAVSQLVEQIVNALFSVTLAYAFVNKGLVQAATGSTVGTGIGALAGFMVVLFVYYKMRPKIKKMIKNDPYDEQEPAQSILRKILITTIPIIISTSVFAVITTLDASMVYRILPDTIDRMREANLLDKLPLNLPYELSTKEIIDSLQGQYSGKYLPIINLPVALVLSLGMAATPTIAASMAIKDYKEVRKKIKMILKVGMLFAAPATVGLSLYGKYIISFIFPRTPLGGELLVYGAIAVIFITLAQLTTGILQGMGKQHIPTIHSIIACVVKIVINFILLKATNLHIFSVIHSTTLCYLIYAVLNMLYLKSYIKIRYNLKVLVLKPMLSASLMGGISLGIFKVLQIVIASNTICLLIIIPIAVILYGAIGIATRTITKKDLENIPGGNKIIKWLS